MRKFLRVHPVEAAFVVLENAVGWGLFSGAVVLVALGKFIVGGMLAGLATLIFLRLKRGRLERQEKKTS